MNSAVWDPVLKSFFSEFHTCGSRVQCKGPTEKHPTQLKFVFSSIQTYTKCAFGSKLKSQLILLFNLFLLLFMGSTVLFSTIYESYFTISTNFYIFL